MVSPEKKVMMESTILICSLESFQLMRREADLVFMQDSRHHSICLKLMMGSGNATRFCERIEEFML